MAPQTPAPPGYPPPPSGGGYPPPPSGGGYPPAPAAAQPVDPYAAERALAEWVSSRGFTLGTSPDLAWYQSWWPCQYAFRIVRVGRELRAQFGEASLFVAEAFEADDVKRLAGEDRHVYAFVTSPRLQHRVALRSKSGGGLVNEVSRGLGSLFGTPGAGAVLGDPTLEQRFDVLTPTRDEGNRALPAPLRQHLVQSGWRGILETRGGGLLAIPYDARTFDVPTLDRVVDDVGRIYRLATGTT